jgi:hypothetical protein
LTGYFSYIYDRGHRLETKARLMTTLIETRANRPPRWPLGSAQADRKETGRLSTAPTGAWVAKTHAFLAVVVPAAADCGEPSFAQWRAELELAGCSRALPLAWPLPEWLDDYRVLLATALADPPTPRSAWWAGAIRTFLQLMLADRDKSAAGFIRALVRLHPFADETRRIRRVQALFASIRPARSLAEALGFTIVTQAGLSDEGFPHRPLARCDDSRPSGSGATNSAQRGL